MAVVRWPRAPGPKPAAAEPKRGDGLLRFFAPSLLLPLLLVLLLLPAAPPLLFPLPSLARGVFGLSLIHI